MLCERTEPVCRARLSGVTTKIPEALILQVPSRVPPRARFSRRRRRIRKDHIQRTSECRVGAPVGGTRRHFPSAGLDPQRSRHLAQVTGSVVEPRRIEEVVETSDGRTCLAALAGSDTCLWEVSQRVELPDGPLIRTPLCPSGSEVLAEVLLGPRPIRTLSRRDRCRPLDPLRPGSGIGGAGRSDGSRPESEREQGCPERYDRSSARPHGSPASA